jgi:chaperone required for assembly of F1-ATPase
LTRSPREFISPPSLERSAVKQTFESLNPPRRFYSVASVTPVEEGFALQLDGRPARTPGGRPFLAPTAALAELIAAEWNAQGERIVLASMPATRLAHTAIDGVPETKSAIAASVAGFAGADLICYLADSPASLVARQMAAWSPLLDWARQDLGLRFEQTAGVVHRDQPAAALEAVQALAAGLDDFRLAGLALAAQLFGSAILALALARGRLGGAEAFSASQIDEAFQAEQWGEDAEASVRTRALADEAVMLEAWFAALNSP